MEYEPAGLYYEDFVEGRSWRTPARTIGEADVSAFSALTGDYTYLHTDAVAAAEGPFGGRIAHGLLGLSYLSGLVTRLGILEGTVEAFMGVEMRFRRAILIGDTVRAEVEVKERRISSRGKGLVTLGMTLLNQKGETAQEGEFVLMMALKGDAKSRGD